MPRFVVLGRTASASPRFSLDDLAGSSGRLDVLLRCVRASLLCSHGARGDVITYLVLGGGPYAPRVVRVDGAAARFVRPDERPLATLVKKTLARAEAELDAGPPRRGFVDTRNGVSFAEGGLDVVLADVGTAPRFVLEEGAPDVRDAELPRDAVFFVGDHLGFSDDTRDRLADATPISVGPASLHSDDAIAVLLNELDRRAASPPIRA